MKEFIVYLAIVVGTCLLVHGIFSLIELVSEANTPASTAQPCSCMPACDCVPNCECDNCVCCPTDDFSMHFENHEERIEVLEDAAAELLKQCPIGRIEQCEDAAAEALKRTATS